MTNELVELGVLHSMRKLLESEQIVGQVRELVIQCYSNLVGDSAELRDNILANGSIHKI